MVLALLGTQISNPRSLWCI